MLTLKGSCSTLNATGSKPPLISNCIESIKWRQMMWDQTCNSRHFRLCAELNFKIFYTKSRDMSLVV